MLEPTPEGWPDYRGLVFREGARRLIREIKEIRVALAAADAAVAEVERGSPEYYKRVKRRGQLHYMLSLAQRAF